MPADALTRVMLDHPAIFGKLPGHGDFIARGMPGDVRETIDLWLAEWLAAARAGCGDSFESDYEAAAPWLFEGPRATAVLMPSMDRVGRLFPLLVVTAPDRHTQAVYDAMVDAVADSRSADDLRAALAALDAGAVPSARTPRWFLPEGADPLLPVPDSVGAWRSVEGCFA